MNLRFKNLFLSQFFFWIIAVIAGSYLMFSVDWSAFKKPNLSFMQKVYKAVSIPKMKLGIDLQGGAHLVVSVDIEKAIDNKLVSESKMIDQVFKKEGIIGIEKKKEVKNQILLMNFDNADEASSAFRVIKTKLKHLVVKRKADILEISLPPQEAQRIRTQSVEQATSVLKRRLDTAGVQGLAVHQHGDRQITIQLPGEADVEEKKDLISKTAHLEFKIVEASASNKDDLLDRFDGDLPADKAIVPGKEGEKESYYLVSAFPDLTGDHIVFAKEDFDQYGKVIVRFKLDSVGTEEFAELTENNVGKMLGIIIDGVMYSAPYIQGPIPQGSGHITGRYTTEEARALSIVLNSGSLQAPIKFEYETRVGASLGRDSIRKGIMSCLIGLLLLFVFGLIYYKLAGLMAFLALLFNLFLVLFFLSWFKFALTLPGIAGLVLTIGMAIDASILIYERIREELSTGTTMRKAVQDGFSSAIVVILDSNITTFLTGIILFKFGGPAVRGFAVTLMAGIIATLFASIFFLKSMFLFILDNTKIRKFGI